ncbi:MAG: molybdenum cofactor guanylyltransferase [Promethearchaeota archaeon]
MLLNYKISCSKISDKKKYLAFVILIGGKSKRFGSDKGLFELQGRPLISYQLEILKKFKNDIFLNANSLKQTQNYINRIDYRLITGFIVDDNSVIRDKGTRSPLIGLYSTFKELLSLNYEKTFILACDNPFIQFKVIKFLISNSIDYECCIPQWENGFVEPLFAIYPTRKAFQLCKKNLENKQFKLNKLLDIKWKVKYISIENEIKPIDNKLLTFVNLNEVEDIKNLKKIYKKINN